MVSWGCASAGGPKLSPPLGRPECWEEERTRSGRHPLETHSPQPSLSLGTHLALGDVWLPQGAQHHVALVHKLLPTHLALQPALSRSLTQAIPLHNSSYSLGANMTSVSPLAGSRMQSAVGMGWQWGPDTSVTGMTTVHTSCTMFCQPASRSMAASITHTCFPVERPPVTAGSILPLATRDPMKHSPWERGWSGLGWGNSQGEHLLNCAPWLLPSSLALTLSHSLIHLLSRQLCDNWPHNVREHLQLLLRRTEGVGSDYLPLVTEPARGRR